MGEEEEVTVMILYVDLKCSSCYKKVKKLLRKFPQIRDQVFDVDKNKVILKVICCDPEKLRDKLCCKGGNAIQSIEIVENPPPPPPQQPKPPQKQPPKEVEKPKPKPPPPVPVPVPVPVVVPVVEPEKPKPIPIPTPVVVPKPDPPPKKPDPPPVVQKPKPQPQPQPEPVKKMPDPLPPPVPVPQPQPQPEPVFSMPMMPDGYPFCPPVSVCCQDCYEGRGGGPCHFGYGRPVPPPPGPCYDYGYQYRPCHVRCDYFSEENSQGCSIM